jgi:mono/diheme cytochrome c family protein
VEAKRIMTRHALLAAVAAVTTALPMTPAGAADPAAIARGKYLVAIAGCNDCHTPGYFRGKPDMARFLAGSDVGFEMPGLGVFHGPNLTPDKATGLGYWTDAPRWHQIGGLAAGSFPASTALPESRSSRCLLSKS